MTVVEVLDIISDSSRCSKSVPLTTHHTPRTSWNVLLLVVLLLPTTTSISTTITTTIVSSESS